MQPRFTLLYTLQPQRQLHLFQDALASIEQYLTILGRENAARLHFIPLAGHPSKLSQTAGCPQGPFEQVYCKVKARWTIIRGTRSGCAKSELERDRRTRHMALSSARLAYRPPIATSSTWASLTVINKGSSDCTANRQDTHLWTCVLRVAPAQQSRSDAPGNQAGLLTSCRLCHDLQSWQQAEEPATSA